MLFLMGIGSLLIWFLISRTCIGKEAVTVWGMDFGHGCFFCQVDVEDVLGCGNYPNSVLEPFPPPNFLILCVSKLNALKEGL